MFYKHSHRHLASQLKYTLSRNTRNKKAIPIQQFQNMLHRRQIATDKNTKHSLQAPNIAAIQENADGTHLRSLGSRTTELSWRLSRYDR